VILLGGGTQTIAHLPRSAGGGVVVLSSATVQIERLWLSTTDADRLLVSPTAATLDTVSTTTTAAAGPQTADARAVTLTSTTGIVAGRSYLLTDPTGRRELAEVEAVISGGVRLAAPLAGPFASASTFRGVMLFGSFPGVEADDEEKHDNGGGPYLVSWSYTIDGAALTRQAVVYVRRGMAHCPATELDVTAADPSLGAGVLGGQIEVRRVLAAAWSDVRADLLARGLEPANFFNVELLRLLVARVAVGKIYRAAEISGGDVGDRFGEAAARWEARAKELLDNLTRGMSKPGTVHVKETTETAPQGPSRVVMNRMSRR